MIGWKVDIGYTSPNINNFSQTVFSDIDRVWGFNIASIDYGYFGERKPDDLPGEVVGYEELLNNLYDYGEKLLGIEVNMLYGYPWRGSFAPSGNSLEYLYFLYKYQITSLNDMYPSMWESQYLSSPGLTITIHFKTLNKVVVLNKVSTPYIIIYQIVDDKLIRIYGDSYNYISFRGVETEGSIGVSCSFIALHKYDGPEDLVDYTNYRRIIIKCGDKYKGGASKTSVNFYVEGDIKENSNFHNFFKALLGSHPSSPDVVVLPGSPENPYEPGEPFDPGDLPPGNFDDTSDPIEDSSLPTLSSANTGFTRIYNPTLSQVQALANYLWTDESVISTIWNHIKQYFEDPMQAIIGFNLVPVPVPDGGTEEFKLMYIGTGVQMTVAASQFVDVDCGTITIEPYYGSYLDYAPYTKISCFLPFIGNVELNPDEIMNTTIQVKYRVDICSGSCVAKILVNSNCLYQYSGHCAINIPISSADFSSYVSAAISVAKLAVGVATAGALGAAGIEAGEIAHATSSVTTTKTKRNPATGRQITSGTTTVTRESTREVKPTPASYSGLTPKNISNTIGEVMGSKPGFQHSGSFSGNTGYLGIRRPFLIITRPNLCLPESYQQMNGFPAMITMTLNECQGFTQVQQVQLTGLSATNPEQDEILQFLKSGVIF